MKTKMNLFKKYFGFIIVIVVTVFLMSCHDEDSTPLINFEKTSESIGEEESGKAIKILLSEPSKGKGKITLIASALTTDLESTLIIDRPTKLGTFTVEINENDTEGTFTVTPIDNDLYTGDVTVIFSISKVEGLLEKGNALSVFIDVIDNENPSIVNFASNGGVMNESQSGGVPVQVLLSSPAKGSGKLTLGMSSANAKYGVNYSTNPAPVTLGIVELPISYGDVATSFTILPIKDYAVTGNLEISFTILKVEGVLVKGARSEYSQTIVNEDLPVIVNFAESEISLPEKSESGLEIKLPFTGPAAGGGFITVSLYSMGNNGTQFTCSPKLQNGDIVIPYNKNDTGVSFKILATDNFDCQTSIQNTLRWRITAITGGAVERGTQKDCSILIVDDEISVQANFIESSGSINENDANGIEIEIKFTPSIGISTSFNIASDCSGNPLRFQTTPSTICDYYYYYYNGHTGYIPITPMLQETTSRFKVVPVNNNTKEGNFYFDFEIRASSANGCIQPGANWKYGLTILNDD